MLHFFEKFLIVTSFENVINFYCSALRFQIIRSVLYSSFQKYTSKDFNHNRQLCSKIGDIENNVI